MAVLSQSGVSDGVLSAMRQAKRGEGPEDLGSEVSPGHSRW